MQNILVHKLRDYIIDNHPDLYISRSQEGSLTGFLHEKVENIERELKTLLQQGKPAYIIEELCMNILVSQLGSSKFNYLSGILEEEFEKHFEDFRKSGVLIYEIINLVEDCEPVFESFGFSGANEDNRFMRYAIIGTIDLYLGRSEARKTVGNGI